MSTDVALEVERVSHWYAERQALADVSLQVAPGEIFVLLGPNGGGKTTLFRLISTLIPLRHGSIRVLSFDIATRTRDAQARMGVVFQAPSLDKKLTVTENLRYQAALYGLDKQQAKSRIDALLTQLGLSDRRRELCETLSGGLRRRVELAKGMLHGPKLLLLDEPSTGLDPGARRDLWDYLEEVRTRDGVTVVMTTHLLEEADKADRIAIIDQGRLVALDTPDQLRSEVGGDAITIATADPASLAQRIQERLGSTAQLVDGTVRLSHADGHQWIARIVEAFPGEIQSITLGRPSLEDVFIARTGHRFYRPVEEGARG